MNKPKRIYVSGPMTGYPNLNFPAFDSAHAKLESLGYEVVNPARLNPPSADYDQCMRTDLQGMLTCDTLVLLPGWERSKGAHLELHVAHRVGIQVKFMDEFDVEYLNQVGSAVDSFLRRRVSNPVAAHPEPPKLRRCLDHHFLEADKDHTMTPNGTKEEWRQVIKALRSNSAIGFAQISARFDGQMNIYVSNPMFPGVGLTIIHNSQASKWLADCEETLEANNQ